MSFAPLLGAAFVGAAVGAAVATLLQRGRKPRLQPVTTERAPRAAGHYSQALINGGEVWVSGLLPITPDGTKLVDAPFEQQAVQVLDSLEAILDASGSSLQALLQVRVYITDVDNWATFNKLYAARLGAHKPARCVVPVPCLHYGLAIEVEAMAAYCQ
mmetsp:Transcript_1347/g.3448  ORF Transcript_1347/g.3448 Transcript_1347/m.3448 type:complete len:158 (-) Transcript_1347:182-655(-)|eukprot:1784971-Prymnesium_polylepis.1